jgi:putative ATP-dependent DNA ligase
MLHTRAVSCVIPDNIWTDSACGAFYDTLTIIVDSRSVGYPSRFRRAGTVVTVFVTRGVVPGMEYHRTLGMSRTEFESLLEHFEQHSFRGIDYRHLPGYRSSLNRGTVLIEGDVVAGFPKVPRTLVLDEGVPRYFEGQLAVEEKLNGNNVRIARAAGRTLAFTRGGIICPFTLYKVQELLDDIDAFLEDHPDLQVCGELYGPENPYTAHDYPDIDSVDFRVFDIRDRTSGDPLPVAKRKDLCRQYGFPQVEFYGVYTPRKAVAELPELIDELDTDNREGIVMKSLDDTQQLKYTTSAANQGDLAHAYSLPFDYGQDFLFRRTVREAFQSIEWDEDERGRRERAHQLGEAILLPMLETIDEVREGTTVGEEHTVRAPPDVVDELLAHFEDMGLHCRIEEDREEDGERVVTFVKELRATNDKIDAYLDGQIVRE